MLFFPGIDEPRSSGEQLLIRVSRRIMATTFEIAFPYGTPHAVEAGTEALDLVDQIEDELTIYRETSAISEINRRASDEAVAVDSQLFELLQLCAQMHIETAGAFDVAIGALIECWGFQQRAGRVPSERELGEAASRSGFRHVVLDDTRQTIRFRQPGLKLNLGAIGKGYALDRAAVFLRHQGITSALLHAGGSSVYAIGRPKLFGGWPVAICQPHGEGYIGQLELSDEGLGTSAATFQYFEHQGKKYGHVLDPRTGRPAEPMASASVTAPSAAIADAISTALFVAGESWSRDFLRPRTGHRAVLLPSK